MTLSFLWLKKSAFYFNIIKTPFDAHAMYSSGIIVMETTKSKLLHDFLCLSVVIYHVGVTSQNTSKVMLVSLEFIKFLILQVCVSHRVGDTSLTEI